MRKFVKIIKYKYGRAYIWEIWFFNNQPNWITFVGAFLVMFSVGMICWGKMNTKKMKIRIRIRKKKHNIENNAKLDIENSQDSIAFISLHTPSSTESFISDI